MSAAHSAPVKHLTHVFTMELVPQLPSDSCLALATDLDLPAGYSIRRATNAADYESFSHLARAYHKELPVDLGFQVSRSCRAVTIPRLPYPSIMQDPPGCDSLCFPWHTTLGKVVIKVAGSES